jgi:hypothetical protein
MFMGATRNGSMKKILSFRFSIFFQVFQKFDGKKFFKQKIFAGVSANIKKNWEFPQKKIFRKFFHFHFCVSNQPKADKRALCDFYSNF